MPDQGAAGKGGLPFRDGPVPRRNETGLPGGGRGTGVGEKPGRAG